MKEPVILSVPEGYELDKEQSNERQIVLKKIEENKARSWKEYCDMMKDKDSYVVDMYGNVRTTKFLDAPVVGEFEDKEEARVFAVFSRLLKLRRNWIGDWKPDWKNKKEAKFGFVVHKSKISGSTRFTISCPLSFPTEEMRDEFLDTFKDFLEIAKPLL